MVKHINRFFNEPVCNKFFKQIGEQNETLEESQQRLPNYVLRLAREYKELQYEIADETDQLSDIEYAKSTIKSSTNIFPEMTILFMKENINKEEQLIKSLEKLNKRLQEITKILDNSDNNKEIKLVQESFKVLNDSAKNIFSINLQLSEELENNGNINKNIKELENKINASDITLENKEQYTKNLKKYQDDREASIKAIKTIAAEIYGLSNIYIKNKDKATNVIRSIKKDKNNAQVHAQLKDELNKYNNDNKEIQIIFSESQKIIDNEYLLQGQDIDEDEPEPDTIKEKLDMLHKNTAQRKDNNSQTKNDLLKVGQTNKINEVDMNSLMAATNKETLKQGTINFYLETLSNYDLLKLFAISMFLYDGKIGLVKTAISRTITKLNKDTDLNLKKPSALENDYFDYDEKNQKNIFVNLIANKMNTVNLDKKEQQTIDSIEEYLKTEKIRYEYPTKKEKKVEELEEEEEKKVVEEEEKEGDISAIVESVLEEKEETTGKGMRRSKKLPKKTTKKLTTKQEQEIIKNIKKKYKTKGGSFFDDAWRYAKNAFSAITEGVRVDYPPSVRAFLKEHYNDEIISLTVYREPIQKVIDTIINLVSLGEFNRQKHNYNYDDMVHVFMIAKTRNGVNIIIEKNQVIHIEEYNRDVSNVKQMSVPMSNILTLKDLLETARRNMGDENYFLYDGAINNCQTYLTQLLQGSRLLNSQLREFLNQPTDQIVGNLPQITKGIMSATVKASQLYDVILHGRAIRRLQYNV